MISAKWSLTRVLTTHTENDGLICVVTIKLPQVHIEDL